MLVFIGRSLIGTSLRQIWQVHRGKLPHLQTQRRKKNVSYLHHFCAFKNKAREGLIITGTSFGENIENWGSGKTEPNWYLNPVYILISGEKKAAVYWKWCNHISKSHLLDFKRGLPCDNHPSSNDSIHTASSNDFILYC